MQRNTPKTVQHCFFPPESDSETTCAPKRQPGPSAWRPGLTRGRCPAVRRRPSAKKKPNKNPKTKIKTPKGGKGAQYLPAGPHKRPEARGRGGVLWVDPHLTAWLGVSRSALWGLWTCPHPPLLKRISPVRPEQPGEAARPPGGPVRSSLQRGDHAPQLCPPDAELGVLTLSEQRGWGSSGPSCPGPTAPASAAALTPHTHFTGEQTEGQR